MTINKMQPTSIKFIASGILLFMLGAVSTYFIYRVEPQRTAYAKLGPASFGLSRTACTPLTNNEIKSIDTALTLLELSASSPSNIGIVISLKQHINHLLKPGCATGATTARYSEIITKYRLLNESRLSYNDLSTVSIINKPSEYMLKEVENLAFSDSYYNEYSDHPKTQTDLRPMARSILALKKSFATETVIKSYNEISSHHPLGTTAAQIAASANYRDSLLVIERLMTEILDSTPANEAVDFEKRDRFIELSYALILAGPAAKKHTAPLEKILNRKIKSWAGHFGAIELHPKKICSILDAIDPENKEIQKHSFCKDENYPLEQ